jgi:uncharacterized protein
LSGISKWRAGVGSYAFAILLPIGLFAFGAFLLWLLTFGLGEEIGWRGYALPRLQAHHNALTATLILGVVWTFWHVPAFFYKDTYMAMGLFAGLPLLLISVIAASIVFTWLYNGTNGSLLIVTIFHGLFDFPSVSRAGGDSPAAIMSAGIMIWAVLIVILFKPANFSRKPKQVA